MRRYIRLRKKVRRAVHRAVLRGDAVYCPCCERAASELLPGRMCAFCDSRPRQRLLWLYLERTLGPSERVLHFAPEECLQRCLARRRGVDYVSADLRSPFADVHVDLESPEDVRAKLGGRGFTVVVISHVLEHLRDDLGAVRSLAGLLGPGGRILVQVPIDFARERTYEDWSITTDEGRLAAFWQEDHVRLYGLDVAERLRGAGVDVEAFEPETLCAPEEIARMALERDTIFECRPAGWRA